MKFSYTLNNLNCAHCAGVIEKTIAKSSDFQSVAFNFATKVLTFESDIKEPLSKIQQICDSIEEGVVVVDNKSNNETASNSTNKIAKNLPIAISGITAISSLIIHLCSPDGNSAVFWAILILSVISTALSGYKIFYKAIKKAINLRIDETTLLFVAVTAAFFLGEFTEAAMVTLLFSLGEIIEAKAVDTSRRNIEKLASIRPDTAIILKDGIEAEVNAESVEIGTTIIVKPYARLPLDGVVTKGTTTIDNSALTGESLPVDIAEGDTVLSGGINGNNIIEVKTTKLFGDSTATRILKLVEDAAAQKSKNEKLISRFASVYTPLVFIISLIIAIVPAVLGIGDFSEWIYRALVCLVASCPCAIVISVPLAYYSGIGAISKYGMLVKGGKYLEALAKADSFVFDKTGTLTSGKLTVNKITALSDYSEDEVLSLAAACEKYSTHPVAMAIKAKAEEKHLTIPELANHSENAGYGTKANYKGKALECGGAKILNKSINTDACKEDSVFIIYDNKLIGSINIDDTIREESKSVISKLKKLGVKNIIMLTGDKKSTAENVNNELNLTDFHSELLPADKLNILTKIKEKSNSVCFVGDGINDAPVLSASDCGIAMGFGSEVAIESADAVLASENLNPIPDAIKIARKVLNIVKINIMFALLVKALIIILAIFGITSMWMSVIADTGVSVICVLFASEYLARSSSR